MRKQFIFLALLVLTILNVKAQNYTNTADSLFQFVDKKTMQTDILYDRVVPFANLTQPKDTTDFEYFRQAYSELYRASYNPTFKHIEQVKTEVKKSFPNYHQVPIGLINTSFDYIKDSLETVDGYLRSKPTQKHIPPLHFLNKFGYF